VQPRLSHLVRRCSLRKPLFNILLLVLLVLVLLVLVLLIVLLLLLLLIIIFLVFLFSSLVPLFVQIYALLYL